MTKHAEDCVFNSCHFCFSAPHTVTYSFTYQDPEQIDTGLSAFLFGDDGAWDACPECEQLADARDFTGLAERAGDGLQSTGVRLPAGWKKENVARRYELLFAYGPAKHAAA